MNTRNFSLVLGVAFLLIGVLGFIRVEPILMDHPLGEDESAHAAGADHDHEHGHALKVKSFEGYLLGLFHVNALHSGVHVLFGLMGIAMSRRWDLARTYCRIVAVSYALLAVMGLIPGLNTVFGYIPIHGHDVWLHALIALAAAYFGFAAPEPVRTDVTTTPTGTVPPGRL
jgi:hypothetical protein